ncbi:MAG: T9SS type A sorting domain-containing protein [Flavobacteriales bacterium]|nr:T9SS type A sorting domain-containing protein [Flavobacteriales bacterium]
MESKFISGTIFDLHEKIVAEFRNEKRLDVSGLSEGIYLMRLQTEERILTNKFLKE